jgi:hypothetical protein
MIEKAVPQQPVISIRISEAMRARLDRLKELTASKSGESVSTSEVAKQLLEAAREDRLELVELLSDPTESLLRIRRKADARHLLSQAEWALVAYYCHHGAEAFANNTPTQISDASLAHILEAFLAAYGLLKTKSASREQYYLRNLPVSEVRDKGPKEESSSRDVRSVVSDTITLLKSPRKQLWKPTLVVRNLYLLLEEEKFPNIQRLNEALWPYWEVLWRVCARGHFYLVKRPLRDRVLAEDLENIVQPHLPRFEQDGYSLTFVRTEGEEFSLCLSFPGRLAPLYPLSEYPKISEFRSMLEGLDVSREFSYWKGSYFFAYTSKMDDGETTISYRAHDNGITFGFDQAGWLSLRELFRRAWIASEVRRLWDALTLEYGEL